MEESRLILALVLSVVVFMVWFLFFTPKQDEKTEKAQKQNPAQRRRYKGFFRLRHVLRHEKTVLFTTLSFT